MYWKTEGNKLNHTFLICWNQVLIYILYILKVAIPCGIFNIWPYFNNVLFCVIILNISLLSF